MPQRFALWIGGLVERIIAQFGGPIEVPPEEMERARKEMEERVTLDRKEAIIPLPPPPCTLQRLHGELQQRDKYAKQDAVDEVAFALRRYMVETGDGSVQGATAILAAAAKRLFPGKHVQVSMTTNAEPPMVR